MTRDLERNSHERFELSQASGLLLLHTASLLASQPGRTR